MGAFLSYGGEAEADRRRGPRCRRALLLGCANRQVSLSGFLALSGEQLGWRQDRTGGGTTVAHRLPTYSAGVTVKRRAAAGGAPLQWRAPSKDVRPSNQVSSWPAAQPAAPTTAAINASGIKGWMLFSRRKRLHRNPTATCGGVLGLLEYSIAAFTT